MFLVQRKEQREKGVVWDEIYSIPDTCTPDPSMIERPASTANNVPFFFFSCCYVSLFSSNLPKLFQRTSSRLYNESKSSLSLRSVSWFTFILGSRRKKDVKEVEEKLYRYSVIASESSERTSNNENENTWNMRRTKNGRKERKKLLGSFVCFNLLCWCLISWN